MKKAIVLTILAIFIITTPAIAAPPSHSNANANAKKENPGKSKSEEVKNENSKKVEGIVAGIEEEQEEKNTEEDEGGPREIEAESEEIEKDDAGIETSVADSECDPNADWKNHGQYVSCVAKLGLGGKVVSEAAKSDIGKKVNDDEATSSATPSPTGPITSPISTADGGTSPLDALGDILEDLVSFVAGLL